MALPWRLGTSSNKLGYLDPRSVKDSYRRVVYSCLVSCTAPIHSKGASWPLPNHKPEHILHLEPYGNGMEASHLYTTLLAMASSGPSAYSHKHSPACRLEGPKWVYILGASVLGTWTLRTRDFINPWRDASSSPGRAPRARVTAGAC